MERIKSMNNLTDQQKGSLLAFVAVMFITPDSLFIRLSNADTWGLVFYRGIIPFITVFLGMLLIYKLNSSREDRSATSPWPRQHPAAPRPRPHLSGRVSHLRVNEQITDQCSLRRSRRS